MKREKKKERKRPTQRDLQRLASYYDMRFSYLLMEEIENDRKMRNKTRRLSRRRKVNFYV